MVFRFLALELADGNLVLSDQFVKPAFKVIRLVVLSRIGSALTELPAPIFNRFAGLLCRSGRVR
jgi:hypothetical protein